MAADSAVVGSVESSRVIPVVGIDPLIRLALLVGTTSISSDTNVSDKSKAKTTVLDH